jgi:CHAT domain-containing protein
MEILHLDLKLVQGSDRVEFRYFWDNPNEAQSPQTPRLLSELKERREKADTDYYTRLPEDYAKTGQALYDWLDGNDRILQNEIDRHRHSSSGIILAISTSQGLAQLPWEVLHDGNNFLVAKLPAIVPIRWVKTGSEKQLTFQNDPANRALNILFMASSARDVEPVLDFESEEAQILEATRRKPLSLIVEESGCLDELAELVKTKERGFFDVIHLTGHATFEDGKPYFITETEFGFRRESSAEDLARGLQFDLPKLIFLSGCRTGYSNSNEVFSMAEELLNLGATAVLGWGQPVLDRDAAAAAATLYQELAAGNTLVESLALTYQNLLRIQARDWHSLRLYVTGTLPEALVTRGRKPLPPPSISTEFIDPEGHLRVATRETFVGRRRELQNCLRVLKTSPNNEIGVFIQGWGGNGKSTIAARLCDRLSDYEKVVWWRQFDEKLLVDKLGDELRDRAQRNALKNPQDELKYRLRDTFETFTSPLLLIFDDFEWNLDYRQGKYILKPEVAEILTALAWAIRETNYYHRIIITCRYQFDPDLLRYFYSLSDLESFKFKEADLQKKLRRLENFNSDKIDESYIERALKLADGNPRLLEWLNKEVLSADDINTQLTKYENSPEGWKEQVIWELENEPKLQLDEDIEKFISRCLIYEIPVPLSALKVVCESISGHQGQLRRARKSGLIEVSHELEELYYVSRIHPRINPHIQLPVAPEVYCLYRKAHNKLHELWGNEENRSEEKWREIFRLLFADKENPERFRQGFSEMLAVQYNSAADSALESELRKLKDELPTENFCRQLEDYLSQEEWRKADEETAWLFYLVMVQQGHEDWEELCRNFPTETLNEIDQLWVDNSQGHFGFSIQKRLWKGIQKQVWENEETRVKTQGGNPELESVIDETYFKFCRQVEWLKAGEWRDYNTLPFSTKSPDGNLPTIWRMGFVEYRQHHPNTHGYPGHTPEGWWYTEAPNLYDLFSRIKT